MSIIKRYVDLIVEKLLLREDVQVPLSGIKRGDLVVLYRHGKNDDKPLQAAGSAPSDLYVYAQKSEYYDQEHVVAVIDIDPKSGRIYLSGTLEGAYVLFSARPETTITKVTAERRRRRAKSAPST